MPTDPPGDVRTATEPAVPSRPPTGSSTTSTTRALGDVVVGEDQIRTRIAELGAQITADYADDPPLLVGVLKGAFVFMADLARAIRLPVEIDFMAVSSYGASTRSSGVVRIVKDLDIDLAGRRVILVEDIVDSGLTLTYLRRNLLAREPASLDVCALFVRQGNQKTEEELRYVGFEIPPAFVLGYGLDVAERYRNLPYVCEFREGALIARSRRRSSVVSSGGPASTAPAASSRAAHSSSGSMANGAPSMPAWRSPSSAKRRGDRRHRAVLGLDGVDLVPRDRRRHRGRRAAPAPSTPPPSCGRGRSGCSRRTGPSGRGPCATRWWSRHAGARRSTSRAKASAARRTSVNPWAGSMRT